METTDLKEVLSKIDELSDAPPSQDLGLQDPDRRGGAVYEAPRKVRLAVKLALATGRPLLLRGDPGSGKSSLAKYVARNLDWRYYEHVVTSQTQARDLLWSFDTVKRLSDAMMQRDSTSLNEPDYVNPGVLWWVLDPESAARRGAERNGPLPAPAEDPNKDQNEQRRSRNAVLLLDEIDKAEPDVPNGLLVPLGSKQFEVHETRAKVPALDGEEPPMCLTMITTNEERELPGAFVRRCIVLHLEHPEPDELVVIAHKHLLDRGVELTPATTEVCRNLADRVGELRTVAEKESRRPPSTAEYLDAVFAYLRIGPELSPQDREIVERLVLTKERPPDERSGG